MVRVTKGSSSNIKVTRRQRGAAITSGGGIKNNVLLIVCILLGIGGFQYMLMHSSLLDSGINDINNISNGSNNDSGTETTTANNNNENIGGGSVSSSIIDLDSKDKDGVSQFYQCVRGGGENNALSSFSSSQKEPQQSRTNVSSVLTKYDDIDIFPWSLTPTVSFRSLPNFNFCRWRTKPTEANYRAKGHWAPLGNVTTRQTKNPILLSLELDCEGILKKNKFGTGNWVQSIYLFRHFVTALTQLQRNPRTYNSNLPKQVDLLVRCIDINPTNEDTAAHHVLPWLMGYYNMSQQPLITNEKDLNTCHADGTFNWFPITWALSQLRFDLQRMAISIVGLPAVTDDNDKHHPAYQFVSNLKKCNNNKYYPNIPQINMNLDSFDQQQMMIQPLIPNVELDDVTIHFRCGDIMLSHYNYFRFLKFRAYSDRIDPKTTKSIGIITQPFTTPKKGDTTSQARKQDVGNEERNLVCQNVIEAFQKHLEKKFPNNVRVTIRNDKDETVGLAYARMVMSKQAFVAPDSSFSIYPALATFGKGYLMYPASSDDFFKNRWLATLLSDDNKKKDGGPNDKQLFFMNETNFLRAAATNVLNTSTNIIKWFEDENMKAPPVPKKPKKKR